MPARILVIDDSLALLQTVRSALESAGYEVETSSQPLEMALDLGRVQPDLVLLDVEMPEVRGTEVLERLRENAAQLKCWVALFSSLEEAELERLAGEVGAQGWIRKSSPIRAGVLARHVRRLLLERTAAREAEQEESERPRALVVDDSRAMRHILGSILTEANYEVHQAEDGQAALELLDQPGMKPRLLLMDLNMPRLNGFESVQAVRERFPSSDDVTILMVTSETDRPKILRALEAGADEYLMKPFTKDSLLQKLETLGLPPQA